jgi:hypothetical protein
MNNFKILPIILMGFLFLFTGEVLALYNTYPSIGGKTLSGDASLTSLVIYLFILITAAGAVIMFAMAVKVGLGMMTGGNTAEAKRELRGSLIGFCVLLSVYLIINSINPEILRIVDIEGECVDGFSVKVKTIQKSDDGKEEETISDACINSDNPDLPEIINGETSGKITPGLFKMVVGYSEPNYQGDATILFNGGNSSGGGISLAGFKSVRMLGNLGGVYLYSKENQQLAPNTSPAPVFTKSGIEDFSKLGIFNIIKSLEALSIDYATPIVDPTDKTNTIIRDLYYGIVFTEPGYRGECEIFDKKINFTPASVAVVSSRQKKNEGGKNYVYLYPVIDCGKTSNKDEDEETVPESLLPVCGSADGKYYANKPFSNSLCKAPAKVSSEGIWGGGDSPWGWHCVNDTGDFKACATISKSEIQDGEEYNPGTEESTDLEALKKVCKIEIPKPGTPADELKKIINGECGEIFSKGNGEFYSVVSFKVDAPAAVVIEGSNGSCIYFDEANIERGGSCVGDIRGSSVFDTSTEKGAVRPEKIAIVPQ